MVLLASIVADGGKTGFFDIDVLVAAVRDSITWSSSHLKFYGGAYIFGGKDCFGDVLPAALRWHSSTPRTSP